jgi:putative endonuclease
MPNSNQWCVYLLRCADQTLYCGISNRLLKRIDDHNNSKGAKYTKTRLPVVLLWSRNCSSKSDAAKLEYCIKQMSRKEKLELIATGT